MKFPDWAKLKWRDFKDDKIVQFYMSSVSFFHVFIVNNWEKCPWGWGFVLFYRPGGSWTLFASLLTLLPRGGGFLVHTVWLLPVILKPVKLGFQNILFVLSLGNSEAEF